MPFMQRQITHKQTWIEIETDQGTEFVMGSDIGFIRDSDPLTHPLTDKDRERITAKLSPYCKGTIQSWKNIMGYGARLSAPGYLDCTEWTVFDTEQEAKEYLDENYPGDDDKDDPSSN